MTLEHYLNVWNLSQPQLLTQTRTSHIYLVAYQGKTVALKLIDPINGFEERIGAGALRYFDGQGAVRLLQNYENAHLLEYAEGEDLVGLVKRGEDEKATGIIADVLNTLHRVQKPIPTDTLTSLDVWFSSLFKRGQSQSDSIYARAAIVARELLNHPQQVRVLHGDIHHENIRYTNGRGWLAFDPKGLYGERTYDAANTLCNPMNMPELVENESRLLRTIGILAEKMGIEYNRVVRFVYVYACLSASWSLEDDDDPAGAIRIAELIQPHVEKD